VGDGHLYSCVMNDAAVCRYSDEAGTTWYVSIEHSSAEVGERAPIEEWAMDHVTLFQSDST
jgi:hypothetical protein